MQGCRNHKTELEGIVICTISGRVKTDFAKGNNLSPIYHPEGLMKYWWCRIIHLIATLSFKSIKNYPIIKVSGEKPHQKTPTKQKEPPKQMQS